MIWITPCIGVWSVSVFCGGCTSLIGMMWVERGAYALAAPRRASKHAHHGALCVIWNAYERRLRARRPCHW